MTNETQTEEVVQDVQAEEVPASLTIQDLANIRNIIDVASQRGAFKPAEFAMIGDTYTKLANFIQAITPPQEAPAAPAEEGAE